MLGLLTAASRESRGETDTMIARWRSVCQSRIRGRVCGPLLGPLGARASRPLRPPRPRCLRAPPAATAGLAPPARPRGAETVAADAGGTILLANAYPGPAAAAETHAGYP